MRAIADLYARMRDTDRVRESELFLPLRLPSELELQARWFAGDFGKQFISSAGDQIEIIQFGTWNREAGPDFRDAAIRLNGNGPVCGCIEIDLVDRNWEMHGHASNPAFEDTVLHVFIDRSQREFFTRTLSNRNVPQVRVDLSMLPDAFRANFALARPGRCQAPLRNLPEEHVHGVLNSAAQFRLQRKAATIRRKIENHGRDEALFQEIAAALGYKENKLPFTLIAQRLPLKFLRARTEDCEAMLFGVAGFLEAPDLNVYGRSTRNYVRQLWDLWWPHRDEMQRLILAAKVWRISSTRPVNHPQRRLAALATLACDWSAFRRCVDSAAHREKHLSNLTHKFLSELDHPFWKSQYTLVADSSPKEMALIGDSRIAEILANICFPLWFSEGLDVWNAYAQLPARLSNRRLETAATRLLGDDPRRKNFLKTLAHQQGFLQIYEDFCLQDNSDCAQCPFPEQMAQWKINTMTNVE